MTNKAKANKAKIELLSCPSVLRPGEQATVKAKITNTSQHPWESGSNYPYRLGNHWYQQPLEMLQRDDGRSTDINADIGESTEVSIEIKAPKKSGLYHIGLDMVRDN